MSNLITTVQYHYLPENTTCDSYDLMPMTFLKIQKIKTFSQVKYTCLL